MPFKLSSHTVFHDKTGYSIITDNIVKTKILIIKLKTIQIIFKITVLLWLLVSLVPV